MNTIFDEAATAGLTVTELQRKFPALSPRILVTLAVALMLGRTVTPFRLCACGCGESVHGKARLATAACRKRVQRERDALAASAPKQFNIVLQYEMPIPIPRVPIPVVPCSEISASQLPPPTGQTGQTAPPDTLDLHFECPSGCHALSLPVTPTDVADSPL